MDKVNKPKVIFLPHANIQYSQLSPDRRVWVIENCYEKLFDLILNNDYKIAFEASGFTLEEMADKAPMVLEKLRILISENKIEPVCSPYTHFMVPNVPQDICLHALKLSMDIWEKYTGKRPKVGWNPECGWSEYVLDVYKQAGLEALIMDGDSFLLSFEEIRKQTGLKYDVTGHSNKNQLFKIEEYIQDKPQYLKYLTNASTSPNGLKMIFRSDCMANILLWYLMGATEGMRQDPVSFEDVKCMLTTWKQHVLDTGSFIMPYAEDAEYIGSSAYFYVKQFNQARFFEEEPESVERFHRMLSAAKEAGYEFALPSEVLENTFANQYTDYIENGVAWHGGTSKAWANTEYSRIMDPVCMSIYHGIHAVERIIKNSRDASLEKARKHLEIAWVSDGRWPPEPTSPGRFNVQEALTHMHLANQAIAYSMRKNNIEKKKRLYSPELMESEIKAIEETLMSKKYFGGRWGSNPGKKK